MLVGGAFFIAATSLAIIAIVGAVADRAVLLSIQTLAFVFALAGVVVIAMGRFDGMDRTKTN